MTAPDPGRMAAEVERRFPGTSVWLGEFTRSWWAFARDRAGACHLVEAATPAALVRRLDDVGVRRAVPRPAPMGTPVPAPRYSRARLTAAPDNTVPDRARVGPDVAAPSRPPHRRQHRAPRRGWLRAMFGGLVAS